jgi:hypothetical protein
MTVTRLCSFAILAFLVSCTPNQSDAQDAKQLGPKDWVSDVAYLISNMERIHPDLYHRHSREQWQAEASRLGRTLLTAGESEAILGFCRLVALAADGHTRVIPPADAAMNQRWLPILPRRFADGWYMIAGHDAYVPLLGLRILEIGGMPVDSIVRRFRPLVSADNAIGAIGPIAHLMRNAAALELSDIPQRTADSVPVVYADVNGARRTRWVEYMSDSSATGDWRDVGSTDALRRPLYRRLEGNYAFEYLPKDRLLYVKFDAVRDDDDEIIADFFARVFRFADSADAGRFALDIRGNRNGSSCLNEPVLHGLIKAETINVPGKLFVIIGRGTSSAAMSLAVAIENNTSALFVGEPTGASPNCFGDAEEIVLPKSGIKVQCSALYWQNSDPRDKRPWITPDIVAEEMWEDFFYGADPALQVVRMVDYNRLKRLFPDSGLGPATEDRIHGRRWQRANQVQDEVWPSLLGN